MSGDPNLLVSLFLFSSLFFSEVCRGRALRKPQLRRKESRGDRQVVVAHSTCCTRSNHTVQEDTARRFANKWTSGVHILKQQ